MSSLRLWLGFSVRILFSVRFSIMVRFDLWL